jgi:type II secretory pathway component PulJ
MHFPMPRRHSRRVTGFTLLEVVLYVALTATVLVASTGFVSALWSANDRRQAATELDSQTTSALQTIARDIRRAQAVSLPTDGTSSDHLILTMDDPAENPTTYAITAEQLTVSRGVGSAVPLTTDHAKVETLTFTTASTNAVTAMVTIARRVPDEPTPFAISRTYALTEAIRR